MAKRDPEKNKGGRPSKYESHVKPRFEEIKAWLQVGATDKEIAENLGIHKSMMCKYKTEYREFNELLKNGRKMPIQEIKAALYKRATGCHYSEKKTVIEYEEWDPQIKDALSTIGFDVDKVGQRKLVRVEIMEKYALPDPASAMILLKHWDKDENGNAQWASDPAMLEIKKEELDLKKKHAESEVW